LKSKTQEEVQKNIAEGIAVIGPVITLDSICEALVIGVGTLSGQ
jgi:hydroxymethylglutaryl-CoA reductase (NADPH)